eukprot:TRINITY_DN2064_c0_g1_i1.p1 TRINITY_DN2064_c0_g1~~TRINITY_DN2064_c0_g1_i1.p1  ORF type:complete len:349 (-),score=71.82 TRINITY_DN2064_c0_g1_i1:73-999(-)
MNALMYSFSCKYGNTTTLMVVSVFYWLSTIFVAYGGSSLAGIGLIMAALAPFAILKRCTAMTPEGEAASAVGLWGGIRALLIAVVVTVIWEIIHIPGSFTRMSGDSLKAGFTSLEAAFKAVFDGKDVDADLAAVSASIGDAETYNAAAAMEPRLWKCSWKKEFLEETAGNINKVRLDVLVMRLALLGGNTSLPTDNAIKDMKAVEEIVAMIEDLNTTLADAKELSMRVLEHNDGPFDGLKKLQTMEGLSELDGFDAAVSALSKAVPFPSKTPESLEEDRLCQMSIVLVMLEYVIAHIAEITEGAVKLA